MRLWIVLKLNKNQKDKKLSCHKMDLPVIDQWKRKAQKYLFKDQSDKKFLILNKILKFK